MGQERRTVFAREASLLSALPGIRPEFSGQQAGQRQAGEISFDGGGKHAHTPLAC